ncbi:8807_t:CDS:2, partial [Cetraspora pellucida]
SHLIRRMLQEISSLSDQLGSNTDIYANNNSMLQTSYRCLPNCMWHETSDLVIFNKNRGPLCLNINNNFLSQTDCPDVLQETSDLLIFDNNQGLLGLNTNNSFSISQNDFSGNLHLSNDVEFVNTDLNEIEYQNNVLELDGEPEDEMLKLEIGMTNIIKINSYVDIHNHELNSTNYETVSQFRKLTSEILSDIEKTIYPLLKHDYSNHHIYKKDLYNAVYKFWLTNTPGDLDASQMLQTLLNFKESDPL